jgi:hypothetical protein
MPTGPFRFLFWSNAPMKFLTISKNNTVIVKVPADFTNVVLFLTENNIPLSLVGGMIPALDKKDKAKTAGALTVGGVAWSWVIGT